MVIDTSALIAVLFEEKNAQNLHRVIVDSDICLVPASVYVEASIVLAGRVGQAYLEDFDRQLARYDARILSFDERHARGARAAFLRFGKGRHPARLNFGDCMSYAVAKVEDQPLLWVGGDFGLTDVASVNLG